MADDDTVIKGDETELTADQLAAQDAADFDEGFEGTETPPTLRAVTPAPVVNQEPVIEPPTEPIPDPDASPPETPSGELSEEPDPFKAIEEKFSGRLRKLEGHIGGLKSQLKQDAEKHAEELAAAQAAIPAPEIDISVPELDDLKIEYDHIGTPVEKAIGRVKKEIMTEMASQENVDVEALIGEKISEVKTEIAEEMRFMPLTLKHPDWRDTIATEEFKTWMNTQPATTQELANSEHTVDAITLLDGYEGSVSSARQEANRSQEEERNKQNRLAAAVVPTSGNHVSAPPPPTSEQDDFDEGFASG